MQGFTCKSPGLLLERSEKLPALRRPSSKQFVERVFLAGILLTSALLLDILLRRKHTEIEGIILVSAVFTTLASLAALIALVWPDRSDGDANKETLERLAGTVDRIERLLASSDAARPSRRTGLSRIVLWSALVLLVGRIARSRQE